MGYVYRGQSDRVMSWRSQWTLNNPIRGLVHSPEKMFGHMVEPGMSTIDTGCGTGFFSLALARMVGVTGSVIAVDVQAEALVKLEEKAEVAGLSGIIETWKCDAHDIGLLPPADFVLSSYMAHEVPDIDQYFARMVKSVKRDGRMLLVEPKFHVSQSRFREEVSSAITAGFELDTIPSITISHAVILRRG